MCILHVNHRKVNRTIIMSLFKLHIMIFKLWLRAGPSWQHHRPLSKAVHGVTTYTTTRRNKNTHDNFKLMKIKYILNIKFSIRTRCSLQYAAVGNGILHTGGKHLHGRINVCFYDFRLDFETVTTVYLVFCDFHFFVSFITALYILNRIFIICNFLWVPNSSISWINIHWMQKYFNIFKLILFNFILFFVLYIFVKWIYRWENINASDKKKVIH